MIRELMSTLPGFATADGEERFILRHSISFGARPQEVVGEELKNGFPHRKQGTTDAEGMLFETEEDFQLNYVFPKATAETNLAGVQLYRFEYDFDKTEKRLYRFWYVFRIVQGSPWFALSLALRQKYGKPDIELPTNQYDSETWKHNMQYRLCWILHDSGIHTITVNLWKSSFGVCFLMYKWE